MKRKLIVSQLSNLQTYNMYKRKTLTLAENVFQFENLPPYIDVSYINKTLVRQGAIAFFKDDVLDSVVALPFSNVTTVDIYGRPLKIQVTGANGYTRVLNKDDFVIMYDNNGKYPLYLDIIQYAERLANVTRTIDINIQQQKTPRFWKTSADREKTVKDIVNEVDGLVEKVITYDDINIDDTTLTLQPAPYVSDKLEDNKDKIWSEFLQLIGVSNLSLTKKERHIVDEITAMQGGTIASRFSRFEPRKRAIDEINKKWGLNIEVSYYDGEPSNKEKEDNDLEFDEDGDENV